MTKNKTTEEEIKSKTEKSDGIIVGDPQLLRPTELPLVVKPESGEWANEAQAELAKVINAYAYKDPVKFAVKKETLITQLKDLGKNPENIVKLRGNKSENLSYKNKLIEN